MMEPFKVVPLYSLPFAKRQVVIPSIVCVMCVWCGGGEGRGGEGGASTAAGKKLTAHVWLGKMNAHMLGSVWHQKCLSE